MIDQTFSLALSGYLTRDTIAHMGKASIRDLRNHGGEVVDRVATGEAITITRDGKAVAELRPLPRRPVSAQVLVERFGRLPPVDLERFRRDVDSMLDQSL
ncbi:MAG: type II toxin-antitoxin system Phd/YefM family antitoxin [Actinomycetota bacterium]